MSVALSCCIVALLQAPTAPAPAATPAPAIAMTPKAIRMRAIMADPHLRVEYGRATAMGNAGVIVASVGAGVGLLVGLPAWLLYEKSLDQARSTTFRVDREGPLAQAQRRLNVLRVAAAFSGSLVAIGTSVAVVGYRRRARLVHGLPATVAVAPVLGGGHYGAAATVRF